MEFSTLREINIVLQGTYYVCVAVVTIYIFSIYVQVGGYPGTGAHMYSYVICAPSIVRFESGKKATFWNPPPPRGDLVG